MEGRARLGGSLGNPLGSFTLIGAGVQPTPSKILPSIRRRFLGLRNTLRRSSLRLWILQLVSRERERERGGDEEHDSRRRRTFFARCGMYICISDRFGAQYISKIPSRSRPAPVLFIQRIFHHARDALCKRSVVLLFHSSLSLSRGSLERIDFSYDSKGKKLRPEFGRGIVLAGLVNTSEQQKIRKLR